jgi:hypothetical protein
MVTKKIMSLLIIAAVIFASGCGSTKNDEDQAWLRSTNSDIEMMQQDLDYMLQGDNSLANLDACDKVVTDAQTALRNNQKYRPTSSKFQKAQSEWDIILNDYIRAAQFRYVAVQKWNTDMSQDSTIYSAFYEADVNSKNALVDARNHNYILYDYIDDE